jgi:hypothetical protein
LRERANYSREWWSKYDCSSREGLKEIKTGVDKTAAELAIARLKGEIHSLVEQRNVARGKTAKGSAVLFGILAGIYFCGGLAWKLSTIHNQDNSTISGTIIVTAIIFGGAAYLIYYISNRAATKRNAPIDKAIAEKTQELEKYQNIVADK